MNEKESRYFVRLELSRLDQLMQKGQLDVHSLANLLEAVPMEESNMFTFDYLEWRKAQRKDTFIQDTCKNDKNSFGASDLSIILNMLKTCRQQSEADISTTFFQDYDHHENHHTGGWVYTIMTYNQHLDKLFYMDFDVKQYEAYSNKIQRILDEDIFKETHFALYESLTKREKEVLRLISLGASNQEISDQLFLSKDTVRTHRNHIWKKLKINTLVEAIKYAQAFDLI